MKKDINVPAVEGVSMAVAKSLIEGEEVYHAYLINHNAYDLDTVIINSQGFGKDHSGKSQKTSQLRHIIQNLKAGTAAKIEMISPEVFHLNNQYWISFFYEGQMLDKKFIFEANNIKERNFRPIKTLGLDGIEIK
ncbi:hypothetical protein [Persicobacter sp. CCB-QB2]|uniref:hypothetical protein n=1 Tax=Persicobacter sp. CCB-QB2 TaxID=1561025 RepID=UPI0006A957E3|nr:hypothetical protein [Persicobacter sp. CCB-QB2]